jgi:tRNA A-37 threonylcarbamoyl transferase component Bud32
MNLEKIKNFTKMVNPKWPVPVKYIGGGANGRVFETNNGRYIKYVMNKAPQEWRALKKLQGNFRFPRIKNGNHKNITFAKNSNSERIANMFKVKNVGPGMTIFIMGKVGGGKAMTLKTYLQKYPGANREPVRNRVLSLIDTMQGKGISHGNLHFQNILVTADSMGRLTGMWVIDFGRSRNIPLGMTERELFGKIHVHNKFFTQNMNRSNVGAKVEVRNGSRANVHMAAVHYNKPYTRERGNAVRKKRLEINKEMKNYKSPKKTTSVRRTQSLRKASPVKSLRRPQFSPSLKRPSSKSASLNRQS